MPGSPAVAERTVVLLREHPVVTDGQVELVVHPALSFLDLAMTRLAVDPVAAGFRLVDGESFAVQAAGERGPLLVAQCWSTTVLSNIKLSVDSPPDHPVTVLYHLGMSDERIFTVAWDELDRSFVPDHLTSLWVPSLASPVAAQLVQLDELVHTLRLQCPWDRQQTHGSLARHLLEESYEVLEAIDELAAIDGAPSTGPPLRAPARGWTGPRRPATVRSRRWPIWRKSSVTFSSRCTSTPRWPPKKGASRWPMWRVGSMTSSCRAIPTCSVTWTRRRRTQVAGNWETLKMSEKNRSSVTEGIPAALPALSLAAKLQRKAVAVGMVLPSASDEAVRMMEGLSALEAVGADGSPPVADGQGGQPEQAAEIGEVLFALVNVARMLGVDPESALRARATVFRRSVEERG